MTEEDITKLYLDCYYSTIAIIYKKINDSTLDRDILAYNKDLLPKVYALKKMPTNKWIQEFHEDYIKNINNSDMLSNEFNSLIQYFNAYSSLIKLLCQKHLDSYNLYFSLVFDVPDEEVEF